MRIIMNIKIFMKITIHHLWTWLIQLKNLFANKPIKSWWKYNFIFLFTDATDQSDQSGIAKSVPIGSNVELECRSTLSPPVSYSWTKVKHQVPNGATLRGSTLILPNVQAENAGFYICKANNR